MSAAYGLRACVFVLMHGRRGHWFNTTDLCMQTGCDSARVRNTCHQLVQEGTAHQATVNGVEYFGIGVEGVPANFQTTSPTQRSTE